MSLYLASVTPNPRDKLDNLGMFFYVIRYHGPTGKVWESERYAATAKEALASFRQDAARVKGPITLVGIHKLDGGTSLEIVK